MSYSLYHIFSPEIKLNEEALEYVRKYTYLGQQLSFRDTSGREHKKELEWHEKCSYVTGLYCPTDSKKYG
jgi:hypothetical protein